MTVESVTDLKDGDACIVLLSACHNATMKGVEYGDHQACRQCKRTGVEWVEHLAPFRSKNFLALDGEFVETGAGPDYRAAVVIDECRPFPAGAFWWG